MPSIRGGTYNDAGICRNRGIGKTFEWNEGIVLRGEHERWNPDVSRDAQRAGPRIIIARIPETAVGRSNGVVELAQSMDAFKLFQIIESGEESVFAPDALLQSCDKSLLVYKIFR